MKVAMRRMALLGVVLLVCAGIAQANTVTVSLFASPNSSSTFNDGSLYIFYVAPITLSSGQTLVSVNLTFTNVTASNNPYKISFYIKSPVPSSSLSWLTAGENSYSSTHFNSIFNGISPFVTIYYNSNGIPNYSYTIPNGDLANGFAIGVNPDCHWSGDFELSYTYATTTPEPASLLLLGTSLGGLALAAWRKKKA